MGGLQESHRETLLHYSTPRHCTLLSSARSTPLPRENCLGPQPPHTRSLQVNTPLLLPPILLLSRLQLGVAIRWHLNLARGQTTLPGDPFGSQPVA